jgi:hypothetical protein
VSAFLFLVLAQVSFAAAAAPLCFPERTVLGGAEVRDTDGTIIGGVRAGQVVRLLRHQPPDEVWVSVDGPVKLQGRIWDARPLVFLRKDVAVEKGLWLLAGTPVEIVRGNERGVGIAKQRGHHQRYADKVLAVVDCRELSPQPVTALKTDWCHGAVPAIIPRATAGEPIHFDGGQVTFVDRKPPQTFSVDAAGLLKQRDKRAYVEITGWNRHVAFIRARGWVDRAKILTGPGEQKEEGFLSECDGELDVPRDGAEGHLAHPIELWSTADSVQSKPFAQVPAGTFFRVTGRSGNDMQDVVLLFPDKGPRLTLMLRGWARKADLPPFSQ